MRLHHSSTQRRGFVKAGCAHSYSERLPTVKKAMI